jgi:Glutathionylspermidine synthase preATP-grasp
VSWAANGLTTRYLDELARDPAAARGLADLLQAPPLAFPFGDRPLSRPVLLEGEELDRLEADLAGVHDLLVSLPERLFGGDIERFGLAVGFDPVQTRLARRTSAGWPPPLVGRADLYRDRDGFKLLEQNLGSALGGFHAADVNRFLLRSDLVRAFAERERLAYVDAMPMLADLLRRPHLGRGLVVALTDWPDSFVTWEPSLRAMAAQLQDLGIDTRVCHVGQLRRGARGLTLDGDRVDIAFRYYGLSQATASAEALELFEPLARACERDELELFTPFTTTLLASKRALVLLSDEHHRAEFSAAERELIDRLLPWTRELRDGPVTFEGETVDLRDLCLRRRASLVLKPGYLFGGVGVVTGWTVSDDEWRTALDDAWNGPFIVQRRVVPVPEPFPDPLTGGLAPWVVLWGVFMIGRRYAGCLIRSSRNPDSGVVNLDASDGVGACFHSACR